MAIEASDISERYGPEGAVGLVPAPLAVGGRPTLRLVGAPSPDGGTLADILSIDTCRTARQQALLRHGDEVSRRRAARHRVKVRRRRAAMAGLTLALLTCLALPVSFLGGRSPNAAATALPGAADAGSGVVYVVQPGDTLASIARRLDPGHPAAMARQLARQTGSSTLVPGERFTLP